MINLFNKRAQEEIVGFVIIVVIIGVIILVLLSFMLMNDDEAVLESYEIESFIDSMLQYTTNCETQLEFLSFQKLIAHCESNGVCLDNSNSCRVLNSTAEEIIEGAWNVNEQSAIKGYEFRIFNEESEIFAMEKGNKTITYKGSYQDFARSGREYKVLLTVYE